MRSARTLFASAAISAVLAITTPAAYAMTVADRDGEGSSHSSNDHGGRSDHHEGRNDNGEDRNDNGHGRSNDHHGRNDNGEGRSDNGDVAEPRGASAPVVAPWP